MLLFSHTEIKHKDSEKTWCVKLFIDKDSLGISLNRFAWRYLDILISVIFYKITFM